MAPVKNGALLFNEVPSGYPIPGKTTVYDDSETIDLETVPLNGGYLVKVLALSIDPYLRGKMRAPEVKSYNAPFAIGQPLYNFGVGVVLRSENPDVKKGDHVYSVFPFKHYHIITKVIDPYLHRVLKQEDSKIPWSAYIGVAGMPGQTAFYAWNEYAKAKKGEVAFITAGSGPVGSFVIQLAKADGLKVIASAGSDEKVEFIKSLGADVAFNYKTQDTYEVLAKEGPVDVYWDNVGGKSLDAALLHSARYGRFIECGMISGYNEEAPPVKNLRSIVSNELKLSGFIVGSLHSKYFTQFYKEIPPRIASGEIKYLEDRVKGLENAGHAIEAVQRGTNKGKMVVVVAEE